MSVAERTSGDDLAEPLVLIVHGEEVTRAWIECAVTAAGYRARCFENASQVLAGITPETTACAILDVNLPDASGLELQTELASAHVSIVFLTRERCIDTCVKAVRAGAVDFLTMPCDPAHLLRVLRGAVLEAVAMRTWREADSVLRAHFNRLTAREREVFALVSSGLLNKQVAERLDISEITVQIHRGRVMRKMAAKSFASLVRMADALQLEKIYLRHGAEAPRHAEPKRTSHPRAAASVAGAIADVSR